MLVKEPLPIQTLYSKDMQEISHDEDEAISLCDLALHSDQSAEWNSLDQSNGSCSSSSYFEFNQEFNDPITTSISLPHENIIFCGKLIPYKPQTTPKHELSNLIESEKQAIENKTCDLGPFRGKFSYSNKNGSRSTTLMHKKEMYNTNEIAKGHKMSVLTSSSSGKGKWYLFMFGISRFSMEVNLTDIKSRRSRRRCSSPPHTPPSPSRNWDEDVSGGRNMRWWLWWVIKALSCGGNDHPTTMATAAIGGAPPEGIN
ncbi:hypothetical protein CDL12_19985 [Handroanthus impetiginosus]|uniref:Uncharacterized protein n=1 Tax=Handroanthus impetiginosus TaxID=429701 RepID=A0A2G9GQC0_9LAMI|nr:hypothetical protein CDL12_19985 [Handroanthus impetiginosus]